MTDLDPAIWENKTLGAAAPNENLERLTKQQIEDRAAKFEGREPREIVVENTYPDWTPEVAERTGTVSSNYQNVHFADEQPHEIPTTGVDYEGAEELEDGDENEEEVSETSETSESEVSVESSIGEPFFSPSSESDNT